MIWYDMSLRSKSIYKPYFIDISLYMYDIDITTSVLEKQTSAILELFSRLLLRPYHSNQRAIPQSTSGYRISSKSGHPRWSNDAPYTILKWRTRRLHTTSGFVLVDVIVFGRSNSTSEPNFIQIGPPAATVWPFIDFQHGSRGGVILLPVSDRVTSLYLGCQLLPANQM